MAKPTQEQFDEMKKIVRSLVNQIERLKLLPADETREHLKVIIPLQGLDQKLSQSSFKEFSETETSENTASVIVYFKVLNDMVLALNATDFVKFEESTEQLIKLAETDKNQSACASPTLPDSNETSPVKVEAEVEKPLKLAETDKNPSQRTTPTSPESKKTNLEPSKNFTDKSAQPEEKHTSSMMNSSMIILSGFITAIGITAVAIAFTVLNDSNFKYCRINRSGNRSCCSPFWNRIICHSC